MIRNDRTPTAVAGRPLPLERDELVRSLRSVAQWVERHGYRGYEPFDGLSSWARGLAGGHQFGERLLQQAIRQCPWNLRPWLGVWPQESTKGRGYMASGYVFLYRATRQQDWLDKATRCLNWLHRYRVSRFRHHSWSNHYDFVSRGGSYTKDDPIIVWTSAIGHAFLEAFDVTGRDWFLGIADSACRWILDLPRETTDRGACLSYLADRQLSVHNASMLGASLLARTARYTGNDEYRRVARAAMEYSCLRQRPDGSWWYAEEPKYHWIDNFHTGYNLNSLRHYIDATGDGDFRPQLESGLEFFKAHFVEDNGRPRYYHTRTHPVDIQCAAQSIDTLALFADQDPPCRDLALRVAAWTIRNMQDARGYFYYRQYPLLTARTPMLHWGQATMFEALAHLLLRCGPDGPADLALRDASSVQ